LVQKSVWLCLSQNIYREYSRLALVFGYITSVAVRVAICTFGEYFCRVLCE
ncbi:hypothetical protein T12_15017, partial [Trichinella patagoniensis]